MSHPAQIKFCKEVRKKYPDLFRRARVIDIGSLDINGNNRRFFKRPYYTGIDIVAGKNVDIVGKAHEELRRLCNDKATADVMISTECLEHDEHWMSTITAMYNYLKRGGLILITCAGIGRAEHGTKEHHPTDSPGTNDYYKNRSTDDIAKILPAHYFSTYFLTQTGTDLQFYGIKG